MLNIESKVIEAFTDTSVDASVGFLLDGDDVGIGNGAGNGDCRASGTVWYFWEV